MSPTLHGLCASIAIVRYTVRMTESTNTKINKGRSALGRAARWHGVPDSERSRVMKERALQRHSKMSSKDKAELGQRLKKAREKARKLK